MIEPYVIQQVKVVIGRDGRVADMKTRDDDVRMPAGAQPFGGKAYESVVGAEAEFTGGEPQGAVGELGVEQTLDFGVEPQTGGFRIELDETRIGGQPKAAAPILDAAEEHV